MYEFLYEFLYIYTYIQLLDVVFVDYLLVNGRGIYPLV